MFRTIKPDSQNPVVPVEDRKVGYLPDALLALINSFLGLRDNISLVQANHHLKEKMKDITPLFRLYFPEDQALIQSKDTIRKLFKDTYHDHYVNLDSRQRKCFNAFKEGNLVDIQKLNLHKVELSTALDNRGRNVFYYLQFDKHTTTLCHHPDKSLSNYFYQQAIQPFRLGENQFNFDKEDEIGLTILFWAVLHWRDERELKALFDQSTAVITNRTIMLRSFRRVRRINYYNPMSNSYETSEIGCGARLTVLHFAVEIGNLIALKIISSQPGVNLNARRIDGLTPFHIAAGMGHLDFIKILLAQPRFNSTYWVDDLHCNALHFAAGNGHLAVVEYLCSLGFDTEAVTADDNRSALFFAVRGRHLPVVKFLCNQGTDINRMLRSGYHVLHAAIMVNDPDLFHYLYSRPNINRNPILSVSGSEFSLLHWAVFRKNLAVVKLIAEQKETSINALTATPSPSIRDKSALGVAIDRDYLDITDYLCNRPDIDLSSERDYSHADSHTKTAFKNATTCKKLRDLTDAYHQHLAETREKLISTEEKQKIQLKLDKLETVRSLLRPPVNVCKRETIQQFYNQFKLIEKEISVHRDPKSTRYILNVLSVLGLFIRPIYSYYKTGSSCFWRSHGRRLSGNIEKICSRTLALR